MSRFEYLFKRVTLGEHTDIVGVLIKTIFEAPFKWLEHKIIECDNDILEEPYQNFPIYLARFMNLLPTEISATDKRIIVRDINRFFSRDFDVMELQIFVNNPVDEFALFDPKTGQNILERDDTYLIDAEERKLVLAMTRPQRMLYFRMMEHLNLDSLTVHLDGLRCNDDDIIDLLHLPYEQCTNNCLKDQNGREAYCNRRLCMLANKYFDHSTTTTCGMIDDCEIILRSFHLSWISSLPETQVKEFLHFHRLSEKYFPDTTMIFDMKGNLVRLTRETYS
jgi:hypothetical protein